MRSFVAAIIAALLAAPMVCADLLPPGTKNIAIDHKFETEKEYPDWVFFIVEGSGGVRQAPLDPKTPLVIAGNSGVGNGPVPRPGEKPRTIPYRAAALVAVPKDAAKAYKTDKELHEAIEDGKVPGMHAVNGHFFDHENAKATDSRTKFVQRYRITKLDAKSGATLEPIEEKIEPGKKEEAATPSGLTDRTWVALGFGIAGVAAVIGAILVRRVGRGPVSNNS